MPENPELFLEYCVRTDPRFVKIRRRHYVPDRGTMGQCISFLVWFKGRLVGIMVGAAPVFGTKARDSFFGITSVNKKRGLNGIINNLLFRLECHEENLATRCMSLWRRAVSYVWTDLYEVQPFGFETFVDELRPDGKAIRNGGLYKADNWTYLGLTAGNTKTHGKEGMAGGLAENGGIVHRRRRVPRKMLFCRWLDNQLPHVIESEYKSSWKNITPEDKARARLVSKRRHLYLGATFYMQGTTLIIRRIDGQFTQSRHAARTAQKAGMAKRQKTTVANPDGCGASR